MESRRDCPSSSGILCAHSLSAFLYREFSAFRPRSQWLLLLEIRNDKPTSEDSWPPKAARKITLGKNNSALRAKSPGEGTVFSLRQRITRGSNQQAPKI